MKRTRTKSKRPGSQKSSRRDHKLRHRQAMDHALLLVDTVCFLAGAEHLIGNQENDEINRLRQAIATNDTQRLFNQLIEAFSLQGISDHAAYTYMDRHGRITWRHLERATARPQACGKLKCYWTFHDCGYRKGARTCAEPNFFTACPLPSHDLRNGRLNQTAYSLFFFIRDVADGGLVAWIDQQLLQASQGSVAGRTQRMRTALIEPLRNVFGVSDKVLQMSLAYLLTSAPKTKPLWLETGANFIAVDTLVHQFLHRTGILRRLNAHHVYGPACYEPNGCADIIARVAQEIDAREINPTYPRVFPRFVQHALWRYCAQLEMNICNGNQIDDRARCSNKGCPLFDFCDRVALQPQRTMTR